MAICPICGEDEESPDHQELHDSLGVGIELPFLVFRTAAQEIDIVHDMWEGARNDPSTTIHSPFEMVFPALHLLNEIIGGAIEALIKGEGQGNGATPS